LIAIIVAAGLGGCADSGRYSGYPIHPIYDPNAPEECRALQSLIEARERYGIVALSQERDLDALRRCGLPFDYGGGPTPSQAPIGQAIPDTDATTETSQDEVQLKLHNAGKARPGFDVNRCRGSGSADANMALSDRAGRPFRRGGRQSLHPAPGLM